MLYHSLKNKNQTLLGGNDINCKNNGNVNVNEIADNMINLAVICRDFGVPDIS